MRSKRPLKKEAFLEKNTRGFIKQQKQLFVSKIFQFKFRLSTMKLQVSKTEIKNLAYFYFILLKSLNKYHLKLSFLAKPQVVIL
jgi:hypothetical protein